MAHTNQHQAPVPQATVGTLALTAAKTHTAVTATLTGSSPTTSVVFQFSMPGGGICSIPETTDASGNATAGTTASTPGTVSCQVIANQAAVVVGPVQTAHVS